MDSDTFLSKIELNISSWDDFGMKQTMEFFYDKEHKFSVKVKPNNKENISRIMSKQMPQSNDQSEYLFWGRSSNYYEFINSELTDESDRDEWYKLTGDIAYYNERFVKTYDNSKQSENNEFKILVENSFFRNQDENQWKELLNQCHQLTVGKDFLSDYKFTIKPKSSTRDFFTVDVKPKDNVVIKHNEGDLPYIISKNVFCIIGGNGSGKTYFIESLAKLFCKNKSELEIVESYFDNKKDTNVIKNVIFISFSPFDKKLEMNFKEVSDSQMFTYIGLQNFTGDASLSSQIVVEIMEAIKSIKNHMDELRKILWVQVLDRISFETFSNIIRYIYMDDLVHKKTSIDNKKTDSYVFGNEEEVRNKISKLSSGQKIFIFILTKLVLNLTERTVVFIDEPELFLHPPIIKVYIRLISDLVSNFNGLAFFVTHSPITVQEVPNECVKVAKRDITGNYILESVNIKTFGESINIINDVIFNIGLQQTGYYKIIEILKLNKDDEKLNKIKEFAGSEAWILIDH